MRLQLLSGEEAFGADGALVIPEVKVFPLAVIDERGQGAVGVAALAAEVLALARVHHRVDLELLRAREALRALAALERAPSCEKERRGRASSARSHNLFSLSCRTEKLTLIKSTYLCASASAASGLVGWRRLYRIRCTNRVFRLGASACELLGPGEF